VRPAGNAADVVMQRRRSQPALRAAAGRTSSDRTSRNARSDSPGEQFLRNVLTELARGPEPRRIGDDADAQVVVHHGGAGTAALGLRHGRPTLCLPALADQFFWGHRVAAIGAGPPPLPVKRLRAARLAERLSALVGRPEYASTAGSLAGAIAREDGCAVAVDAVERFLAPKRRPNPTRVRGPAVSSDTIGTAGG
jgi:hypothetical protein